MYMLRCTYFSSWRWRRCARLLISNAGDVQLVFFCIFLIEVYFVSVQNTVCLYVSLRILLHIFFIIMKNEVTLFMVVDLKHTFFHQREERGHVVQSWWTHRMHSIEKISDGRVAVLCVDVQQEASKDTKRRKETTATLTSRQRSRTTMGLEVAQNLDHLHT